jgi:signal transduction histidine kinase/CheY-like chemotaxis protein
MPDPNSPPSPPQHHLARRYWKVLSLLVGAVLLLAGVVEMGLAYRGNVALISKLQQTEARTAARLIADYLQTVERQAQAAAKLPWGGGSLSPEERRTELHRLLNLFPAILEVEVLDSRGVTQIHVSRLHLDSPATAAALREAPVPILATGQALAYGPTYFRTGSAPHVPLAIRIDDGTAPLTLLLQLNLTFVADLVGSMRIGEQGKAFIIDRDLNLVAHPDLSLVLSKPALDATELPRFLEAEAKAYARNEPLTLWTTSIEGGRVLTSVAALPQTGWKLLVEQPASEVLVPVWSAVYRTLAILLIGLVIAFAASRWLARSLTQPIVTLRDGAARIGAGDLSTRIELHRDDELAALAQQFNLMAEQLQGYTTGLEDKISQRTCELVGALEEVRARRDEADRANSAKSRFLATASHDLRQPLHAISLLVDLLANRLHQPELMLLAGKVQQSVKAMENLFNGLLDISKLDAGVVSPMRQPVDLGQLLNLLELKFSPLAHQKGLALKVIPTTLTVDSDPSLLERIVSNLISNAIRYTEHGRVTVGCRRRGDSVEILVIDTGIGIAPAEQQTIFEEFYQSPDARRTGNDGLGLGLAIVQRSAALLAHPITVQSQLGRGSRFSLLLPKLPKRVAAPAKTGSTSRQDDLANLFIAIIDDDLPSRDALAAHCQEWGCHVVIGASRSAILQVLAQHLRAPDLIFTDLKLSGGETGIDVIHALRDHAGSTIPALVITGDFNDAEALIQTLPAVHLARKPCSAEMLKAATRALLAG